MIRNRAVTLLAALCLVALFAALPAAATTYYVKSDGNNGNNGQSWASAELTIGAAITDAASGDEIWVAAGTYDDETFPITLPAGVALYGGFPSGGGDLSSRNPATNVTTIHGDSQHRVIVVDPGAGRDTVIDGFTIESGLSTEPGGGILCTGASPTISNNVIQDNEATNGAGIYAGRLGDDEGLIKPVPYSMIDGGSSSVNTHYWDDAYFQGAHTDYAQLSGGTGDLTNNTKGTLLNYAAQPGPWVGWQNRNIEVTFDFGRAVDLDRVKIHTMVKTSVGISLFKKVVLTCGMTTGSLGNAAGYLTTYEERTVADPGLREIAVPFRRTARYVRLAFERGGEWLFLSEIEFAGHSAPLIVGNKIISNAGTSTGGAICYKPSYTNPGFSVPSTYSMMDGGGISAITHYWDDSYFEGTHTNYAQLSGGHGDITDGLVGTNSCTDPAWVGWQWVTQEGEQRNPVITFDFGSSVPLHGITIHNLVNTNVGIQLLSKAKVTFSNNGTDYGDAVEYATDESDSPGSPGIAVLSIPFNRTARYAKAEITRGGEWLFISEIRFSSQPQPEITNNFIDGNDAPDGAGVYVKQEDTAFAALLPSAYSMTNGGSYQSLHYRDDDYGSYDDYAELSGHIGDLTDGDIGSSTYASNDTWVGWQNRDPTITFDFGREIYLDHVIVNSLMNTVTGIHLFSSVIPAYGDNPASLTVLDAIPTSGNEQDITGMLAVNLGIQQKMRYLSLAFTRGDEWLFISEIQFVGTEIGYAGLVRPIVSCNTITDNTSGAGVECVGLSAPVDARVGTSPIIANNIVASNPEGISATNATPSLRHNNVYGNTTNYSGLTADSGSISSDPLFATDGLHLLSTSPCIDAGNTAFAGPTGLDIDRDSRVRGNGIDMGADEFPLPTISIGGPSPTATNSGPVTYTVTYAGASTIDLDNKVTVNKSGTANCGSWSWTSTATTATVTVPGTSGDGSISITIAPGSATDDAGNPAPSASSTSCTIDNTVPTIRLSRPSVTATKEGPVNYTVTYYGVDDEVTLNANDINLHATGNATGTVTYLGAGSITRTITISGISGEGSLGISIDAGSAHDKAGNQAPAVSLQETFIVKPTVPVVTDGGVYTPSTSELSASWTPTGQTDYRYSISTVSNAMGSYIVPWTETTATSVTRTGLSLKAGWTYYFHVQAQDSLGVWSEIGVSNGILAGTSDDPADEADITLIAKDFLAGIGDFEWAGDTSSVYAVSDATEGDRVATGWSRNCTSGVSAGNRTYDLDTTHVSSGSKCQYFSCHGLGADQAVFLWTRVPILVDNDNPSMLHTEDQLTLKADRVDYTFRDVQVARYYMCIVTPGAENQYHKFEILSSGVQQSTAVEIPTGVTNIQVYFSIETEGDLASTEPGLYIDGIHLTATRSGDPITIETPLCKRRTIATNSVGYYGASDQSSFYSSIEDPDYLARAYDWMMLGEDAYFYGPGLRAANPDIKLYLYESADATDRRSSYYSNSPLDFTDVMTNGSSWLYADSSHTPPYVEDPLFVGSYFSHLENSSYQAAWAQSTLDKIDNYHFDGVFIDVCSWLPYIYDLTGRAPSDCQRFLHYMVGRFDDNNCWNGQLPVVIQNNQPINFAYDGYPDPDPPCGSILCDPTWQAGGSWPTTAGYEDNAGHITDTYSEYTFFTHGSGNIQYDRAKWKSYLDSMKGYGTWTRSIPLHCNLWADANESSTPGGTDGWVQFGLCSYLLGQNDYTTFGVVRGLAFDYAAAFDVTKDYVAPAAEHYAVDSSDYCRARQYYGDNGGARGGIVIANGDFEKPTTQYPDGVPHSHNYTMPSDMLDESDVWHYYNTSVEVLANKGRMFFNPSGYQYNSVITSPEQTQTITSSSYTVQGKVRKNRANLSYPSTAKVKIDGGAWQTCSVNSSTGEFTYNWTGITTGTHYIYSQVFVSDTDKEPEKPARVCYH